MVTDERRLPPVVQSEPTPPPKPPLDPRPYAWFKRHDPVIAGWIDEAAEITGASPDRLAVHKWLESGKSRTSARGAAGEIGIMQFMPATWHSVDPKGQLDPADGKQAMVLAGTYINQLDGRYGKDTPLSVARYNGSGPMARAYARRAFGASLPEGAFAATAGSRVTPQGAMQAGAESPQAFLRYMVETTPRGMTMSDKWRNVEATLVQAMLQKGDIAGAQAARDFVMSMSYGGTNMHLMAAHKALMAGQGVTAAQHLAAAHAFFPDGTIGRFRSDGRNVFAERVDEDDPSRSFGRSPVTPDAIAGLLNQTSDPQKYLKTLLAQQSGAAQTRLAQLHGDYYAQKPELDRQNMALDYAAKQQAEQGRMTRAGMREQGADARFMYGQQKQDERFAQSEAGKDRRAAMRGTNQNFDQETNALFDPQMNPNDPSVGRKSVLYNALRRGQVPGPMAQQVVNGLTTGDLRLSKSNGAVVDKSGNTLMYLAPSILQQFSTPITAQPRQVAPPMIGGALPGTGAAPSNYPAPPQTARPQASPGALQYYSAPSYDDEEYEE